MNLRMKKISMCDSATYGRSGLPWGPRHRGRPWFIQLSNQRLDGRSSWPRKWNRVRDER